MSINITSLAVESYNADLRLALQKKGSKLRPWIMWQPAKGEFISPVDLVNPIAARRSTTRGGVPVRVNATFTRYWCTPTDIEITQEYDKRDVLRMFNEPQPQYVTNGSYAVGRELDTLIGEAYFATATTGKKHETTEAFTGQDIAIGFGGTGNLGLNPAKVKEFKRKAIAAHIDVDQDPLVMPIGSTQWSNMLDHPEITSSDFSASKALETGSIGNYLGVKFPLVEALPTNGSTTRYIPAYCMSAMYGQMWSDVEVFVDPLPETEGRPMQVMHQMTVGITRGELKKMQRVLCYDP